VLCQLS